MKNSFSIIIPNYNNKQYIARCVNSILNQNYFNYEILIIDDGSTDGSYKYLEKLYGKNKKIKLLCQEHMGVSCARNLGIKKSKNEWIVFVDSDDYIQEDFLKKAVDEIISSKCDMLIFNIKYVKDDIEIKNKFSDGMQSCIIKTNDKKEELINSCISINSYGNRIKKSIYGNSRCIGGKIYNSKIIKNNNIKFSEKLKTFEDGIFNIQYIEHCNVIKLFKEKKYYYFQRKNSSTQLKEFYSTFKNYVNLKNIFKNMKISNKIIYNYFQFESINMLLNVAVDSSKNYDKKIKNEFNLIREEIKQFDFLKVNESFIKKCCFLLILLKIYFIPCIIYKKC